jgi:hypothetical protein
MRIAIAFAALLLAAAAVVPAARAQLVPEPVTGRQSDELVGANGRVAVPPATNVLTVVYDNTPSPANFGFSQPDLAGSYGDELFTIGTGILSENKFTIFNGSTTAGQLLLTASVRVSFFDGVTSALLGNYTTNTNFGTGLNPGFFATIDVTGIDPANINLNTNDVIVVQKFLSTTGTITRIGIASQDPPTVGSSPNTMFISTSSIPAGFYNINSGGQPLNANPGYLVAVNPPPVPTTSKSWTQIKKLYR